MWPSQNIWSLPKIRNQKERPSKHRKLLIHSCVAYETYLCVCEVVRPRHKDKYGRSYALLYIVAKKLSYLIFNFLVLEIHIDFIDYLNKLITFPYPDSSRLKLRSIKYANHKLKLMFSKKATQVWQNLSFFIDGIVWMLILMSIENFDILWNFLCGSLRKHEFYLSTLF